jgi:hypothetical protein
MSLPLSSPQSSRKVRFLLGDLLGKEEFALSRFNMEAERSDLVASFPPSLDF